MPTGVQLRKNGDVVFSFDADTLFSIGDVARFTGYDEQTLRRLEKAKTIPASVRDDGDRRTWRAIDILKIREHRNRSAGRK